MARLRRRFPSRSRRGTRQYSHRNWINSFQEETVTTDILTYFPLVEAPDYLGADVVNRQDHAVVRRFVGRAIWDLLIPLTGDAPGLNDMVYTAWIIAESQQDLENGLANDAADYNPQSPPAMSRCRVLHHFFTRWVATSSTGIGGIGGGTLREVHGDGLTLEWDVKLNVRLRSDEGIYLGFLGRVTNSPGGVADDFPFAVHNRAFMLD
jgi:hypothetical protein